MSKRRRLFQQVYGGGWNPSALAGCVLWLPNDPTAITVVSGNVSAWSDRSGNANNASQSNAGLRPAYVASGGAKGLGYVSVTAGSTQLLTGTSALPNVPLEFFIVCRSTVSNPVGNRYLFDNGNNVCATIHVTGTNTMEQFDGSVANSTSAITTNTDMVVDSFFNGASSTLTINGVKVGPANAGANNPSAPYNVGGYGGGGFGWDGFIYEVVVLNRQANATDLASLRAYWAVKYGIAT